MVRRFLLLLVACAAALSCLNVSWTSAAPPFLPVHHEQIKVPAGVQPWSPAWTPDGKNIVFEDQRDGNVWITGRNGKGTKCITCGFDQPLTRNLGFTYPFRDYKRIFISQGLGALGGADGPVNADAYILECNPSILDCTSHEYVPVDMSEDKGGPLIIQRRTFHLTPDEEHLGWMDIRLDGTAMIVGRLERQASKYYVSGQRVINPSGPVSDSDDRSIRWENHSQLYELKSFADGGRSAIVVSEAKGNVDQYKIDLKTGKTSRITGNKDWDEDGAESPDGRSTVVESWRTRNRLDANAWIPQIPAFTGLHWAAALAPYYVSTYEGFQCDLSPWLLPSSGDMNGRLVGQPLEVLKSSRQTLANNLSGHAIWSPDSTRVLLQERLRERPSTLLPDRVQSIGVPPSRISIARIQRPATRPLPVVSSAVGEWAPAVDDFKGTLSSNRTATVKGKKGGSATIVYAGDLRAGSTSVTFDGYTDDGRTFVNGTMSGARSLEGVWSLKADVRVTGSHTGRLDVAMEIGEDESGPTMSGRFNATYDGRRAPKLPGLGQCYADQPRASSLRVQRKRLSRNVLSLRVTANIAGDRRPVKAALVRHLGKTLRTSGSGKVRIRLRPGKQRVRVTAGDTFKSAGFAVTVKKGRR